VPETGEQGTPTDGQARLPMPDTRDNRIPPVTAERHGGESRDSPTMRQSQQAIEASIREKIQGFFRIQSATPFFLRAPADEENMEKAAQLQSKGEETGRQR